MQIKPRFYIILAVIFMIITGILFKDKLFPKEPVQSITLEPIVVTAPAPEKKVDTLKPIQEVLPAPKVEEDHPKLVIPEHKEVKSIKSKDPKVVIHEPAPVKEVKTVKELNPVPHEVNHLVSDDDEAPAVYQMK
jgi:hypothetical protein